MTVLQGITGIMVKNRDCDLDPEMNCGLFGLIVYDMLFCEKPYCSSALNYKMPCVTSIMMVKIK